MEGRRQQKKAGKIVGQKARAEKIKAGWRAGGMNSGSFKLRSIISRCGLSSPCAQEVGEQLNPTSAGWMDSSDLLLQKKQSTDPAASC